MSRVFLAEERRLARQVVIKVLPPEMGAGVNVERFEREIQLAARLQHPHIVPLLTAGASGDLLYYVMPFIAGESLRVKLAREGELPVNEALRILREVVDALAYAHRNGVVHRDIKPDNVLLSEGHAVVTDFGVAKAVSASSGRSSLTSLGVALGTPAYMAPEQAAADPHVDQRADIYAVGALAYEMLCGRPPFVAPTPQALLAAHITQAPEPPMQHRRAVTPVLNAILLRCLEKRPADRWQAATELAAQLEAVATPSAGMTPSGTQPIVSAGAEAALRRRHPGLVAALFAGGSLLVLGVVYALVHRLGLPDWVLYGAGLLLLIGLPIMLVATVHERRRAVARTTGLHLATPAGGLAPWMSWRRALLGGGLAFLGLAAVAAGYTAMRLLGIGPVGTLVASGVLDDRELLLLADFENRSPDSTLGASLTEAFRVDLSQSPTLRLLDPQGVSDALRRMQRPTAVTLTPALAQEIAEREGVKAVVTGQIDPVGQGYVLSASLVAAADGRTLTAVRESADDQSALLPSIDRLSKKLRERIGESLTSIRANAKLEEVTTGSLEALRKYSEALRLDENSRSEEAIPLLEEAVALDSGFAMAWRKLAVVLGNADASHSRQVAAATAAFRHRERLPGLERDLATAYYHAYVEYDPAKVIAAYRSALAADPDNLVSLNNLALQYLEQRRYAEAESLVTKAARLGRGISFTQNLVASQILQGHLADAEASAQRFRAAAPDSWFGQGLEAWLASVRRDHAATQRVLLELREKHRDSRFLHRRLTALLAAAYQKEGRLAEARKLLAELMADAAAEGNGPDHVAAAAELVIVSLRYGGRAPEAFAPLTSALARFPLESMDSLDRPYLGLAWANIEAGRSDEARRLLRQYEAAFPEGMRRGDYQRHQVYGALAEAEKRDGEALTAYREWHLAAGECGVCGRYEIAQLHDRQGAPDSALVNYQYLVEHPSLTSALRLERYTLAPAYRRLGELYEARGDRRKAADYYGRFVDLWKNADSELQPAVREARGRLAQLAREPGA
jgi:tetratricopeptide (TPR) repeat protein